MTRTTSDLTRAALLVLLPAAGCAESADTDLGELRMGVIGSDADGNLYRLRDGTFTIDGSSPTVVSTEDSPDPVDSLLINLPPGPYSVTLEDGWRVEEWDSVTDTATDVTAVLTSANPVQTDVLEGLTSAVRFGFFVDGAGPVVIGEGGLDIDVDFSDACETVTDEAQCNTLESCDWNAFLGQCEAPSQPPPSGTLDWTAVHAGPFGADDSFAAVAVDAQGRIVAVGRTQQGTNSSLLVQYSESGSEEFVQIFADGRMDTVAFDDAGVASIGTSGPFSGSAAGAATFDLDAPTVVFGPNFGSGPVLDADAASGAAFLDSNQQLTRLTPSGALDWTQNVQLGSTPLAVAVDSLNPAQPLVLSRSGSQLELSQWNAGGQVSQMPLSLFGNGGAELEALPGGFVLVASSDGAGVSVAQVDTFGSFQQLVLLPAAANTDIIGLDVSASGEAVVAYELFGQTQVARFSTSDGTVLWEQSLAPADVEGGDVAIAPDGAVYVAGSINVGGATDAAIVRLAP